jgi:hypothetical protein
MCELGGEFEFEIPKVAPNLKAIALVCLRISMKYQENQESLFYPTVLRSLERTGIEHVEGDDSFNFVSPNQHILDMITESIMKDGNQLSETYKELSIDKSSDPL